MEQQVTVGQVYLSDDVLCLSEQPLILIWSNISFQDIQKNHYKEQLEAARVQIIPKDHVSVQTKIALGRPYSGDVYNAQWTQHQNHKVG